MVHALMVPNNRGPYIPGRNLVYHWMEKEEVKIKETKKRNKEKIDKKGEIRNPSGSSQLLLCCPLRLFGALS